MYETIVARLHRVELALIGNEHTLAADAETHLMVCQKPIGVSKLMVAVTIDMNAI